VREELHTDLDQHRLHDLHEEQRAEDPRPKARDLVGLRKRVRGQRERREDCREEQ